MGWIAPRQDTASFGGGFRASRPMTREDTRSFLGRVHTFMAIGLTITGLVALATAATPALLQIVMQPGVFFGLCIAELLMVLAFTPVVARASTGVAAAMFFGYAALSGLTFATIFLRYTTGSIGSTFLVTAASFAGLSIYGAVTKRNLDGVGSFAAMGLIGLVIASIVNIFLGSPMLYWLTTFAGVIVFTALTAYDTAKIKEIGAQAEPGEARTKLALQGALVLYLDFVNLFLMLLRLFGRRRD